MNRLRTIATGDRGFTLVEAMIAVAVLMLGVLVLEKNFISSLTSNNSSQLSAVATSFASSQLERLQALPFNDRDLMDFNSDGIRGLNSTVDQGGSIRADHALVWNSKGLNGTKNAVPQAFDQARNLNTAGPWDFVVFWSTDNVTDAGKREIRLICRWRDPNRPSNIDPIRIPAGLSGAALTDYFNRFGNQELVLRYVKINL